MKKNVHFVFFSLISIWVFAYPPIKKTIRLEMEKEQVSCCSDTLSDGKYNRQKVITEFANTLNMLKPNRGNDKKGFYLDQKCQLVGAFIWDITDTLNNETILNDSSCIALREGHIYHFSPTRIKYSYSNIAILNNGRVIIFKAINCPNRGDKLEDVIQFIIDSLHSSEPKEELINRVKNYRKYGAYLGTDEQSEFICK